MKLLKFKARDDIRIALTDIDMPGGVDGLTLSVLVRDCWPPVEIVWSQDIIAKKTCIRRSEARFFRKPYSSFQVTEQPFEFTSLR